jgi:membrane associated rhomboid family serine protease
VVHRKEYHRLFTGALVHGDWLHLFINLLVFYSFAPVVEVLVGHWQLFVIYWGSELVATIPDIVQHRNNAKYASLGASGAISGLTFCYILHLPLSDILLFFAIPMPAWLFGVLYLAYSHFAARRQWDHVNHNAHLYGAIGGLLFTAMIAPEALSNFARQLGL